MNKKVVLLLVGAVLSFAVLVSVVMLASTPLVAEARYVSGRVAGWQILPDAIDGTKIQDHAIDSNHYVNGSIDNIHKAENSSYWTVVIDKEGPYTATKDPVAIFQMPCEATLVEVSATALSIDTTDGNETYVVDLEENGVSVLDTDKINITAACTPVVGTVADSAIADNAMMNITLTLGGATPSIEDLTVLIVFKSEHVAA